MMVERSKQAGISHNSRDLLKICENGGQLVSTGFQAVTLSGPGAFLLLFFLKTWCTSSSMIWSAGVGERGYRRC